jgi:hypothetical protein
MEFVTKPIHQSSSCDDEKLYGMEYRISNGYPQINKEASTLPKGLGKTVSLIYHAS